MINADANILYSATILENHQKTCGEIVAKGNTLDTFHLRCTKCGMVVTRGKFPSCVFHLKGYEIELL